MQCSDQLDLFQQWGIRSSENNHNSDGFTSLRKEMCISSPDPFNGKVFGTVLVTSGKQDSFLPQKFGFDEV